MGLNQSNGGVFCKLSQSLVSPADLHLKQSLLGEEELIEKNLTIKILVLELVQYSDYLSLNDLCQLYDTCKNIPLNMIYFKNKNYIYDFFLINQNPSIRLFKSILEIYPPYNFDPVFLFSAVKKNYSRYIYMLTKYLVDFDFNISSNEYGWTLLWTACRYGKTKSLKALLNYPKIDINKASRYDITPLHIACSIGNSKCVELLLSIPGLDVNKADKEDISPLFAACWCGHTNCVKLLLSHPEIDIYKAKNDGMTPLNAALHNNRTEIIELLNKKIEEN